MIWIVRDLMVFVRLRVKGCGLGVKLAESYVVWGVHIDDDHTRQKRRTYGMHGAEEEADKVDDAPEEALDLLHDALLGHHLACGWLMMVGMIWGGWVSRSGMVLNWWGIGIGCRMRVDR